MKLALSFLLIAASVLCSQAELHQWVLQYNGYCDTNKTDSFRKCYGKAQSQDMEARIDSDDGVDFEISKLYIGPVSQMFIVETFTNDEDYTAVGNMTFGTLNSVTSTLSITFDSDDIHTFYDDNGDYAAIGRAQIATGDGAFNGVTGELTMNTISTQNEDKPEIVDWTAILVANLIA